MSGSNRISKHTALSSGLHDADIRPPDMLGEFKRLSEEDAAAFFGGDGALEPVDCPGCGHASGHRVFTKSNFAFQQCPGCQSLYVSPRPRADLLDRYWEASRASRYRAEQFNVGTADQRRVHILRGYAAWMAQVLDDVAFSGAPAYGDLFSYWPSLFEEVSELALFGRMHSVAPRVGLAGCSVPVEPVDLMNMPPLDVVSAFEQLEHLHNPRVFLRDLGQRMASGGWLFLTTRTASGFDLQVLWDKAPYVFVPEHLNLLSIAGLERLLVQSGFELVELSTPGQLDVEQVLQACEHDPTVVLPPVLKALLTERGPQARTDFQSLLQKHRLSSHVRLVARRTP